MKNDPRKHFSALQIIHKILREHVQPGDICIDATAGRGKDTLFLAELVGETGHVTAFDIQEAAVESTRALLAEHGMTDRAEAVLDSHANMAKYAQPGTVSAITFNFGWLPGGDHNVFTRPESSIAAIEAGLELLRDEGIMTLILYYGRETGFEERDALLAYLPTIDSDRYTVIEMPFVNRPNCPPIPIVILKG
ncbi:MAG: methyltransferase domain-containing protein [Oscillospiraceae bacterium]|nr:methyltransferase domain-containing protein [Oscillospiraceae bacterium]